MKKCIIFDLDDTLYNERQYVECAMRHVAEYIGDTFGMSVDGIYKELIDLLDAHGRGAVFDTFIERHGIEASVQSWVVKYRETKPVLILYEDAELLLQELKRCGIKTAIITDGCRTVQHNKIQALHLQERIDEIIVTDDYDNIAKPSVVPYQMILQRIDGIKPDECIYIGDNPKKDFIGARAAGMMTARIVREIGDNMKLIPENGYEADVTIRNLMDLLVCI